MTICSAVLTKFYYWYVVVILISNVLCHSFSMFFAFPLLIDMVTAFVNYLPFGCQCWPQIFAFPMKVGSSTCTVGEKNLLDSLLATLTNKDDDSTYAFLESNIENESCKRLLSMWNWWACNLSPFFILPLIFSDYSLCHNIYLI